MSGRERRDAVRIFLEINAVDMRIVVDEVDMITDTQWASWDGILNFYKKNEAYLQGQLGNYEIGRASCRERV